MKLSLEFFIELVGSLEMIIQRVEIIDKLLIVFHSDVGFHLFYASDLLLVAGKLLFNFFYYALEGFDFLLGFILC